MPTTAQYEIVTFTHEGKRYYRRGKTLAEAHAKAAKLRLALENGDVGLSGKMTVKAWVDEWLETYKRPAIGDGHHQNYLAHINGVIVPQIGNIMLKDVKDVHLQKVLNSRAGKSKSDITRLRSTIKAVFRRAYLSRLIVRDPSDGLELPAATDGTHRSITERERRSILALAETHHAGLWIKTLLYTGMRPGETRALDWRHIDFKKNIIHVEVAMKSHTREISGPKSKAGVRDIPINKNLLGGLLAARGEPFAPVFTKPTDGKRHTESSMRLLWNNFKRELDIAMGAELKGNHIVTSFVAPDLSPYCLRHAFCTDLQDVGVPINIAKYLMGHSDISMTAKIYTHTTEKAIQTAADLMNGVAVDVAQSAEQVEKA